MLAVEFTWASGVAATDTTVKYPRKIVTQKYSSISIPISVAGKDLDTSPLSILLQSVDRFRNRK